MNVINRTTKLRWRRSFKRKQRIIEGIGSGAEEHIDRHFFRRLGRLYEVRRFILGWLLLVVLVSGLTIAQTRALGSYYQTVKPLTGGIYSEGIVGSFTNANPIFAAGEVDSAVARLLFMSLMTYDSKGQLVGEIAKSLSIDTTGKVYTMVINNNIYWQDNKPLTSEDILYTIQLIQNPDVKSPLFSSWQGIKVAAPDIKTITFTLPNVLASFPHALIVGILPKHVLGKVAAGSLRSSLFNTTQPVGSGPFGWKTVSVLGDTAKNREQAVTLSASNNYYRGKPKVNEFIVRTFLDESQMLKSFKDGELTAMAGVQDLPDDLKTDLNVGQYNVPLAGEVLAFFNTSSKLLGDVQIRRALESSVDQQKVLSSLSYPSIAAKSPFLKGMSGYDPAIVQKPFDVSSASNILDAAGWAKGKDGKRSKGGQNLKLTLNTLNTVEYASVANVLQAQWKQLGVEIAISSLNQADLQGVIDSRSYDILVYGISLGSDPDQFAYWHSSQADIRANRRLNFSNYSSKVADASLEAGRTRTDPGLRAAKYKPFLESWRDDAPAIALYQPHMLYVSHGNIFNFDVKKVNTASDRYNGVQNWMIRTEHVTNE
jgi:peptide/nickel transport system substrate-binding protein